MCLLGCPIWKSYSACGFHLRPEKSMPRMYEQLPVSIQQSLRVPLAFKQKILSVKWTSGGLHHKIPLPRLPLSHSRALHKHYIYKISHPKSLNALSVGKPDNYICHFNTKKSGTNQQHKSLWASKQEYMQLKTIKPQKKSHCVMSQFVLFCKLLHLCFRDTVESKARHAVSVYKAQQQNIGQIWPRILH